MKSIAGEIQPVPSAGPCPEDPPWQKGSGRAGRWRKAAGRLSPRSSAGPTDSKQETKWAMKVK